MAQGVHTNFQSDGGLKSSVMRVACLMTLDQTYSILITDDDPVARETLARDRCAAGLSHADGRERGRGPGAGPRARGAPRLDGHASPTTLGAGDPGSGPSDEGGIPAILITADQDDNLMRRALSEHAFCVLAKPVSKHVVIYVVHKAIEKYYN